MKEALSKKLGHLTTSEYNLKSLITDRFPLVMDVVKTQQVYKVIQEIGDELAKTEPSYVGIAVSGSRAQGVPTPNSDVDISILVTPDYHGGSEMVKTILNSISERAEIKTILNDLYGGILDTVISDKLGFLNSKIAVKLDPSLIPERFEKLISNDFLTILDGRYTLLTSFGNLIHFAPQRKNILDSYRSAVITHAKSSPKLKEELIRAYSDLFIGIATPLKGIDSEYQSRMLRLTSSGLTTEEIMEVLQYRIEKFALTNYFPELL